MSENKRSTEDNNSLSPRPKFARREETFVNTSSGQSQPFISNDPLQHVSQFQNESVNEAEHKETSYHNISSTRPNKSISFHSNGEDTEDFTNAEEDDVVPSSFPEQGPDKDLNSSSKDIGISEDVVTELNDLNISNSQLNSKVRRLRNIVSRNNETIKLFTDLAGRLKSELDASESALELSSVRIFEFEEREKMFDTNTLQDLNLQQYITRLELQNEERERMLQLNATQILELKADIGRSNVKHEKDMENMNLKLSRKDDKIASLTRNHRSAFKELKLDYRDLKQDLKNSERDLEIAQDNLHEAELDFQEQKEADHRKLLIEGCKAETNFIYCSICQNAQKNIVFFPCSHVCTCKECFRSLSLMQTRSPGKV
jgi:hypothetical protein